MNVLIAYEESQVTCKAFRIMGHNAFSCDIQECSGGNYKWYDKLFFDIKDKKLVSKLRSKSFPGIAKAMAMQWGNII